MKPAETSLSVLILAILGLVLVGAVMVGYLWETLNQLMAGHVDWMRVLVSIPVLAVFLLLLRFMAQRVESWHGAPDH